MEVSSVTTHTDISLYIFIITNILTEILSWKMTNKKTFVESVTRICMFLSL